MSEDNVAAFPSVSERLVKRAMHAKEEYAKGRQHAVEAVREYGAALLEGREAHPNNKAFAAWVVENGLDRGAPWDRRPERSCAMQIAEIDRSSIATDTFKGCPYARPTHIMSWYRKLHPWAVKGKAVKAPAKKKAAQLKLVLNEEQQLANAEFTPKGKISIEKAIALHKKRLDRTFQQKVGEEVRREIDRADSAARQQLAQLRKENLQLSQIVRQSAVFTPDDYKTILACLHPDNSASQDKRARAFDLFKQKERRLVGQ